jgi:C-terminal processing protease CtpA/Prc
MKDHLYRSVLIFGIIIHTFLFSACSEKSEHIHISSKSKVWLGVQVKNIPERRLDNLKLDYGLEVTKVYKDSPAEQAGLEEDDILLKINGNSLDEVEKLKDILGEKEPEEKIKITYLREGKELETEATISKKERNIYVLRDKNKKLEHFMSIDKDTWLGVSTDDLSDQLRHFFNVPKYLGVLVNEVVEDSPAEKSGLKAGDVIIQVGNNKIEDSRDLMRVIELYEAGEVVEVKIIRDKKEKIVKVTLDERKGRFPHHFSFEQDIEIVIPKMDIEIPEIEMEELENLNEKLREEFEQHSDELNEELEKLNEELKKIKIRTSQKKSITI